MTLIGYALKHQFQCLKQWLCILLFCVPHLLLWDYLLCGEDVFWVKSYFSIATFSEGLLCLCCLECLFQETNSQTTDETAGLTTPNCLSRLTIYVSKDYLISFIFHMVSNMFSIFLVSLKWLFVPLLYDRLELLEFRNLEIYFYSIRPGFLTCLLNIIGQSEILRRNWGKRLSSTVKEHHSRYASITEYLAFFPLHGAFF